MTTEPQAGDVLLRGDVTHGFQLVDAISHQVLAGPITTLEAALERARALGAHDIWQQSVDNRGRALGDPFRLFHPPQESKTAV